MRKVTLVYFKESGKYYSEGEYLTDKKFDFEIYREVRFWSENKIETLPNLSSNRWNGFILVQPQDGVMGLIDLKG